MPRPGSRGRTATPTLVVAAATLCACSEPIYLGSDVIWLARHEGGQLEEWQEGGRGGALDVGAEVTSDQARHGRFALALRNPAEALERGPCVARRFEDLPEAYYSAWFLVPEAPTTLSAWNLLRFQSWPTAEEASAGEGGAASVTGAAGAADGGSGGSGATNDTWRNVLSLSARSLADGAVVLYVFDHSREHLQLPLAVPPPILPTGRWFHLEAFYRTSPEPDGGMLVVWLDGQPVYALRDRALGDGANVSFNVCNIGRAAAATEVFVDDAVVSRLRTTPRGVLSR